MEFQELLDLCDDIRRRYQCRDDSPNYSYKQRVKTKDGWKYVRSYTACLLLYPDNNNHMQVLRRINELNYMYACILHDSDLLDKKTEDDSSDNLETQEDDILDDNEFDAEGISDFPVMTNESYDGIHKKPHIHVVISFLNARTNTAVAKELELSSNFVVMYHKLEPRLAYLVHRDNVDKYQYSPNKVVGPLSVRLPQINAEYGRRLSDLLHDIIIMIKSQDSRKILKASDLMCYCLDNGYDRLLESKYFGVIREVIYEHNNTARWLIENGWQRDNGECPFAEI